MRSSKSELLHRKEGAISIEKEQSIAIDRRFDSSENIDKKGYDYNLNN